MLLPFLFCFRSRLHDYSRRTNDYEIIIFTTGTTGHAFLEGQGWGGQIVVCCLLFVSSVLRLAQKLWRAITLGGFSERGANMGLFCLYNSGMQMARGAGKSACCS